MNSFNELENILNTLNFRKFYEDKISGANLEIDFGEKKKRKNFTSIKCAANEYVYEDSGKYSISIDRQLDILEFRNKIDEAELILQCIEVFDWGGVQKSNIIDAINLYRNNSLGKYLIKCKDWFQNDKTLEITEEKLLWSSGWTKVFSFMFNLTTIYDSRVAAYINYIFIKFYNSLDSEEDRELLRKITMNLVSFSGTQVRARCLNKEDKYALRIKNKSSNGKKNFIANKTASWFLRYICQLEFGDQSQDNFRKIDKAMFMLGFDISQIDKKAGFVYKN